MKINIDTHNGCRITNIDTLNIVIGRNGAGKSRFLRSINEYLYNINDYNVRYVSPERAGTFKREGHILTQMENDPHFVYNNHNKNQASNYKSVSANLFRDLEIAYLRKMQNDPNLRADVSKTFTSDRVSKINSLFNNTYMKEVSSSFEFYTLSDDLKLEPDQISSGESEAVSLCSEIMYFFDTLHEDKFNVLILDEPDVHLHPDLQYRLSRMILSIIGEYSEVKDNYSIFISTHSSSIISSFVDCNFCSIGTKHFGCDVVELKKFSSSLQKMGPLIGHSLSLYLSKDTPLILEGEDDDRVWQQVCRSSEGEIRLFPVVASSVSVQFNLEKSCSDLMQALYDNPVAISIRDGDGSSSKDMQDIGVVKRFALRCYEIENILVTDECLKNMNQTWRDFIVLVNKFIADNPNHQHKQILIELLSSKDRLRHKKIKSIRNLIVGICGVSRPWEVVVGQTIASKLLDVDYRTGMLVDFMGKEFLSEVYRAKDWGCV